MRLAGGPCAAAGVAAEDSCPAAAGGAAAIAAGEGGMAVAVTVFCAAGASGAVFLGAGTTAGAPATCAGGFTMTGPEGGREAMAGIAGAAVTICGACLG